MRDAGFDHRIAIINDVVAEAADERPWVTFVDTDAVLGGSDGGYVDRLPGIDEDLRQGDGIHLSRAGADLLARHLLELIDDELTAGEAKVPIRDRNRSACGTYASRVPKRDLLPHRSAASLPPLT